VEHKVKNCCVKGKMAYVPWEIKTLSHHCDRPVSIRRDYDLQTRIVGANVSDSSTE
jgi:hypothetical protein